MGNTASSRRRKFDKALENIRSGAKTPSKLKLKNCGLTSGDATKLAEALKQNGAVTELNLWNNSIGPKGAGALAEVETLEALDLGGNGIFDEGAILLASALERKETRLQKLYLQDNAIRDPGAKALARALRVNTTLEELYLHVNSIGDQGIMELIRANRASGTLKILETYGSNVPVDLENQVLVDGGSCLKKGGCGCG